MINKQWRSQDFNVGGHTGDVARKSDAGVGFFGGGAAQDPSLSARRSGGELSLPPPPNKIFSDLHESCGHACRC